MNLVDANFSMIQICKIPWPGWIVYNLQNFGRSDLSSHSTHRPQSHCMHKEQWATAHGLHIADIASGHEQAACTSLTSRLYVLRVAICDHVAVNSVSHKQISINAVPLLLHTNFVHIGWYGILDGTIFFLRPLRFITLRFCCTYNAYTDAHRAFERYFEGLGSIFWCCVLLVCISPAFKCGHRGWVNTVQLSDRVSERCVLVCEERKGYEKKGHELATKGPLPLPRADRRSKGSREVWEQEIEQKRPTAIFTKVTTLAAVKSAPSHLSKLGTP